KLRLDLEKQFGEEYGRYLSLLKEVRRKLKEGVDAEERIRILYRLIESDLLDLVRERRNREIQVRIQELTGLENFDLSYL
ncbi:MAG: hypothetical protein HZA19_02645, partial [Nitrospirae bacterium]|nr:hypothetical protein [Nitrospirota bacterium]